MWVTPGGSHTCVFCNAHTHTGVVKRAWWGVDLGRSKLAVFKYCCYILIFYMSVKDLKKVHGYVWKKSNIHSLKKWDSFISLGLVTWPGQCILLPHVTRSTLSLYGRHPMELLKGSDPGSILGMFTGITTLMGSFTPTFWHCPHLLHPTISTFGRMWHYRVTSPASAFVKNDFLSLKSELGCMALLGAQWGFLVSVLWGFVRCPYWVKTATPTPPTFSWVNSEDELWFV